jgi:hypothetical protein
MAADHEDGRPRPRPTTKTDFARHRHAENPPTTRSLRLSFVDTDFCDCSIQFGIVLARWRQDFDCLQSMAQVNLTTMAKRRFKIAVERDT